MGSTSVPARNLETDLALVANAFDGVPVIMPFNKGQVKKKKGLKAPELATRPVQLLAPQSDGNAINGTITVPRHNGVDVLAIVDAFKKNMSNANMSQHENLAASNKSTMDAAG